MFDEVCNHSSSCVWCNLVNSFSISLKRKALSHSTLCCPAYEHNHSDGTMLWHYRKLNLKCLQPSWTVCVNHVQYWSLFLLIRFHMFMQDMYMIWSFKSSITLFTVPMDNPLWWVFSQRLSWKLEQSHSDNAFINPVKRYCTVKSHYTPCRCLEGEVV